jgi:hypothetical protein
VLFGLTLGIAAVLTIQHFQAAAKARVGTPTPSRLVYPSPRLIRRSAIANPLRQCPPLVI